MVGGGRYMQVHFIRNYINCESHPIVKESYLLNADLKLGYVCDKEGKPQSTAKTSDFEVSFFVGKNYNTFQLLPYANFGSPMAT